MPAQTLTIDGHTLAVVPFPSKVDGPPIFLMHGITASVHFWTPELVAPFTAHGPCYALSLPGHYPAAFPRDFSESSLNAELIANLLTDAIHQVHDDSPVVLVGHSTGGFAALDVAARAPELARAVISISGFANGTWTGALGLNQKLTRAGKWGRQLFKWIYATNRINRAVQRASWFIYTGNRRLPQHPNFDPIFNNFYPAFKRLDLEAMAKYFAVMPNIDITARLTDITAPTLVVVGDHDPIVPPAQAHLIADEVPNATMTVLPGVGHLPFLEDHGGYQRTVYTWLNQHLP